MTELIAARAGGFVTDSDGNLALHVTAGALNVDTMITILSQEKPPPSDAGYSVLRTWRIDAYPAPVELNAKARLAYRAAPDAPDGSLRLYVRAGGPGGSIPADGWQALSATPMGDGWLDGNIWYLPPARGVPSATYSYVCLVRVP